MTTTKRTNHTPQPCIKCGVRPVLIRWPDDPNRSGQWMFFQCPKCGLKGFISATKIGAAKGWGISPPHTP